MLGPEGLLQPVWMEFHGIHRIAKTVRMEYAGKTHSGAKRKQIFSLREWFSE
jgi:hypothetical protein